MRRVSHLILIPYSPRVFLLTIQQTYAAGLDIPSSFISDDFANTAVTIVQNKLGLNDGDVAYNSGYSSDTADHAYLRQSYVCVLLQSMHLMISLPTRMVSRSSMPSRTWYLRTGRFSHLGHPLSIQVSQDTSHRYREVLMRRE